MAIAPAIFLLERTEIDKQTRETTKYSIRCQRLCSWHEIMRFTCIQEHVYCVIPKYVIPYYTALIHSLSNVSLKSHKNCNKNYKLKSVLLNIFDVIWISIFKFHHFFKALLIPVVNTHYILTTSNLNNNNNNNNNSLIINETINQPKHIYTQPYATRKLRDAG